MLSTNTPLISSAEGGETSVGISTGYKHKHKQSTTRASVPTVITPSMVIQSNQAAADTAVNADGVYQSPQPLLQPGENWAAIAMSSPVIATNNRFSVLQNTDDNCYVNECGAAQSHNFQEVRSRRSMKRRRQQSTVQHQQSADSHQQEVSDQQAGRQPRQRNSPLMTGTSGTGGLAAAKKIVKKAVLCIDNVDTAFELDDVQRYVSNFPVHVLSCFSAKPRRCRNENEPVTDRKAFRLCIAAEDRDILLDPAKWPDSVTISEWYHLPPSVSRRLSVTDSQTGNTAGGRSSDTHKSTVTDVAATAALHLHEVMEDMVNDDTILVINLDTTTSTHHGA